MNRAGVAVVEKEFLRQCICAGRRIAGRRRCRCRPRKTRGRVEIRQIKRAFLATRNEAQTQCQYPSDAYVNHVASAYNLRGAA